MISKSRIFYINSRNRNSGTDSNFLYSINLKEYTDFTHCCILQAEIPKSYYLVPEGKNTFTLEEDGKTAEITIEAGNYNRKNFATYLQTILNNQSPNGYTYTVSYTTAPDTGKFIYSVSGNSNIQPGFILTTYVYEQLGLNPNETHSFTSDTLTSTNVVKFQREDSIYLHSSLVGKDENNVIQSFFTSSQDFDNITYTCPDIEAFSKPVIPNADTYSFYLTDEDDQELDLNGQNFNIVLLLYKKEDTNELIRRYIKFRVSNS